MNFGIFYKFPGTYKCYIHGATRMHSGTILFANAEQTLSPEIKRCNFACLVGFLIMA